ncbi:MAG: hypothetical protein M9936_20195 [Caldilinea sp.]|nr:hypothetical protein [Caldilineaceae bacterium]MCB9140724.1 hypothetical protein [Anaerolineales bacterium]MCO5212024.1 hypothetical protein [Caldilinea sp.]
MTTLTLHSQEHRSLRPIVEAALDREARLLEVAIRQTQARLHAFESQYKLRTDEFLRRFANDEMEETLDLDEWIGESRLLNSLMHKRDMLKGITFVD